MSSAIALSPAVVAKSLSLSLPPSLASDVTNYIWGLAGLIPADALIQQAVGNFGAGLPANQQADLTAVLQGLVHFGELFAANKLGLNPPAGA